MDLINAALAARARAYAPYSRYLVGAAIVAEDGVVFEGCNIENVSFPVTICAERVALSAMIASGRRAWKEIAVVTRDGGTPCGMCLQMLLEFSLAPPNDTVLCVDEAGNISRYSLLQLLPHGFHSTFE